VFSQNLWYAKVTRYTVYTAKILHLSTEAPIYTSDCMISKWIDFSTYWKGGLSLEIYTVCCFSIIFCHKINKMPMGHNPHLSHLGPYMQIFSINIHFIPLCGHNLSLWMWKWMILINLHLHYVQQLPFKFNLFCFNGF
jgi:hypothetical protein